MKTKMKTKAMGLGLELGLGSGGLPCQRIPQSRSWPGVEEVPWVEEQARATGLVHFHPVQRDSAAEWEGWGHQG